MSTKNPAHATTDLEHRRAQLHGAFGNDAFGRLAEQAARFFGTPQYIVGQTLAVLLWVVLNSTQVHLGFAWDVYPFIALNLLFSLQAAYAAPRRRSSRRSPFALCGRYPRSLYDFVLGMNRSIFRVIPTARS